RRPRPARARRPAGGRRRPAREADPAHRLRPGQDRAAARRAPRGAAAVRRHALRGRARRVLARARADPRTPRRPSLPAGAPQVTDINSNASTTTSDDGLDRATMAVAGVVVLGAIMSILDVTVVNVAIKTLSVDFQTPLST